MFRLKVLPVLSLATLFTPAFSQGTNPARPGTINYVEGQAAVNGSEVSRASIGHTEVDAGQLLSTGTGKAEMLLTPGVFLRLDDNSVVKMISPDLTHTEVALQRGRAEIEVDQISKANNLQVDVPNGSGGAAVSLVQRGLYEVDARSGELMVFDGKAAVSESNDTQKRVDVKGGHELALNGTAFKGTSFNKKASEDDLYNWSSLRSQSLGEANASFGNEFAGEGVYAGWAWSPGFYGYTWFPGDGLFYSPFGFGFYSPGYFYGGYGLRGGYGYRGGAGYGYAGGVHASVAGGGFHGGGGRR